MKISKDNHTPAKANGYAKPERHEGKAGGKMPGNMSAGADKLNQQDRFEPKGQAGVHIFASARYGPAYAHAQQPQAHNGKDAYEPQKHKPAGGHEGYGNYRQLLKDKGILHSMPQYSLKPYYFGRGKPAHHSKIDYYRNREIFSHAPRNHHVRDLRGIYDHKLRFDTNHNRYQYRIKILNLHGFRAKLSHTDSLKIKQFIGHGHFKPIEINPLRLQLMKRVKLVKLADFRAKLSHADSIRIKLFDRHDRLKAFGFTQVKQQLFLHNAKDMSRFKIHSFNAQNNRYGYGKHHDKQLNAHTDKTHGGMRKPESHKATDGGYGKHHDKPLNAHTDKAHGESHKPGGQQDRGQSGAKETHK